MAPAQNRKGRGGPEQRGNGSAAVLVAGRAEKSLAAAVRRALGAAEPPVLLEHFPDGELHVEIQAPVAGRDVYVLVALAPPIGERLLELTLLQDACRRGEAATVTAVVPYWGYARQARRRHAGEPVAARVMADLVGSAAFTRVLAVDLHDPALEGVLGRQVEHLTALPLLAEALRPHTGPSSVVVSPDLGAVKLAEEYARRLGLPLVVVVKERLTGKDVAVRRVVGEVVGSRPVIVDDMISTGGTIAAAARALLDKRCAPEIVVAATHGLFAPPAEERLAALPIQRIITTDSVPGGAVGVSEAKPRSLPALAAEVVSLAPLLTEAIRRLQEGEPLADLLASR